MLRVMSVNSQNPVLHDISDAPNAMASSSETYLAISKYMTDEATSDSLISRMASPIGSIDTFIIIPTTTRMDAIMMANELLLPILRSCFKKNLRSLVAIMNERNSKPITKANATIHSIVASRVS